MFTKKVDIFFVGFLLLEGRDSRLEGVVLLAYRAWQRNVRCVVSALSANLHLGLLL